MALDLAPPPAARVRVPARRGGGGGGGRRRRGREDEGEVGDFFFLDRQELRLSSSTPARQASTRRVGWARVDSPRRWRLAFSDHGKDGAAISLPFLPLHLITMENGHLLTSTFTVFGRLELECCERKILLTGW